jgi:transcriptional regulator with XRE-family HTH domain
MKEAIYETLIGKKLILNELSEKEKKLLQQVQERFQTSPEWTEFASWRIDHLNSTGLSVDSVVYQICQDLEARLGVSQGKVAPPDYRDYLADLIKERYGSFYKFHQDTGIDRSHLSRVLAGRSDFSIESLREILRKLGAVVVIRKIEDFPVQFTPDDPRYGEREAHLS